MNSKKFVKFLIALIATVPAFLAAVSAKADVSFRINVDTSSLVADARAPFALDFQLTGGDTLSNMVTLSNFMFGGGTATSDPVPSPFGTVSGDLLTLPLTMTSSTANPFNEFFQGFQPGSFLSFDVRLTTNLNGPTPDAFSFAILDNLLVNLPTSGPGNSLLFIDINSGNPTAQVFSSDGITVTATPLSTFTPIPEPSTAFFGVALLGFCGLARRPRVSAAK